MTWVRKLCPRGRRRAEALRVHVCADWEHCDPECLGWLVADCDVPLPPGWDHVQRCDECGRFVNDDEAARHVSLLARRFEAPEPDPEAERLYPRVAAPTVSAMVTWRVDKTKAWAWETLPRLVARALNMN